jgi:hypothetical protein
MTIRRPVGDQLRTMSATETTLSVGETLTVTVSSRDETFTIRNEGAARLYRPTVGLYGVAATFTAQPQLIERGETDTMRVSDWNDIPNSRIELDIDRNSDGTPEMTRVLQAGRDNTGILALLGAVLSLGTVVVVVTTRKPRGPQPPDEAEARGSGWEWLASNTAVGIAAGPQSAPEARTTDGATILDAAGVTLAHVGAGQRTIIGRATDAGLQLQDVKVSSHHAVIEAAQGPEGLSIRVVDLGSSNGTYLDEAPIGAEGAPWTAGSELRVGDTRLRWI